MFIRRAYLEGGGREIRCRCIQNGVFAGARAGALMEGWSTCADVLLERIDHGVRGTVEGLTDVVQVAVARIWVHFEGHGRM